MKKAIIGMFVILLVFSINGNVNSAVNDEKPAGYDSAEENDELLQLTAGGHILGFKTGGVYIASGTHMLHTGFAGSNPVEPVSTAKTDAGMKKSSPLEQVIYEDLWEGVDVEYKDADSGVVKSTYYIEAGAKVNRIRLKYNVPVEINQNGELVFTYTSGQLSESKPVAWQVIDGEKKHVEIAYKKTGEKEAGFKVENYDSGWFLFDCNKDYDFSIKIYNQA